LIFAVFLSIISDVTAMNLRCCL